MSVTNHLAKSREKSCLANFDPKRIVADGYDRSANTLVGALQPNRIMAKARRIVRCEF
jgi:hypothetical protein